MKTIQILFVLALVLLSIDTVSAQYGITVMEVAVTVMATEEITR
jgi:hypothetical protein